MIRELLLNLRDREHSVKEYFLKNDSELSSICIISAVFLIPPMTFLDFYYYRFSSDFFVSVFLELLFALFSIGIVLGIRQNSQVNIYEKLVFAWVLTTSIFAFLTTILQPSRVVENILFSLLFFTANFLALPNKLLFRIIPAAIIWMMLITSLMTNRSWFAFSDKYMFSLTFLILTLIGLLMIARNNYFKSVTFGLQNDEREKRVLFEALSSEKSHLSELLQVELVERKHAESELMQLNANLEKRVIERTAEQEIAIKELESFSYTVGHDLRSPLRGINGFSKVIIEDYGNAIPADVHDQLARVEDAAKKMGELVDALLDFSRLTRAPIRRENINLSELVRNQYERNAPQDTEFIAADGIDANADPGLTQLLIAHLLDNAVKFTSKTINPRIEFGVLNQEGQQVYFIRDNGAGFNMAYAKKIFQPFQKFHHPGEFPGNGVGLVTAYRIIQRHGGRIWADAEPDKGATFYFTL